MKSKISFRQFARGFISLLLFNISFFNINSQNNKLPTIIEGVVICNQPQWIILTYLGIERSLKTDSMFLSQGGNKVALKGEGINSDSYNCYVLSFEKRHTEIWFYYNNTPITVKIDMNKSLGFLFDAKNSVFGSPATVESYNRWNNRFQFSKKINRLKKKLDSLKYTSSNPEEINEIKIEINKQITAEKKKQTNLVLNAKYPPMACEAFRSLTCDMDNFTSYVWLADSIEKKFPKSKYVKEIVKSIRINAKMYNKVPTSGASPRLELKDVSNKVVKLSNYLGNYVLLDFWASWCTPCIKEMPKTIEFKKKYANKGLKVITISIDKNKEAWLKAIEKHNMQGLINLHDEKGEAARAYNVSYVPLTVLINPEGKIIGSNIRGEELEKKLERVFSERNK